MVIRTWLLLVGGLIVLAGGCAGGSGGGYTIEGRAVASEFSDVLFVPADDGRLGDPGVRNVEIRVIRDPDSLKRETVGRTRTNPDGDFQLTLDAFGAGWLEENWMVQAVRPGYAPAQVLVALPRRSGSMRLLVMLTRSEGDRDIDQPETVDDLWEQYERFK